MNHMIISQSGSERMFSKAGKISKEKYTLLQQADDILSDRGKTCRVSSLPSLPKVSPRLLTFLKPVALGN